MIQVHKASKSVILPAAMDAFNKAVAGIVLSWSPSDVALSLEK